MRMRARANLVFASAAVALVFLVSTEPLSGHVRITTDLSFSEDVRPVLRKYCMGCHSPGGSAPSYVDLTTYGNDGSPGARAWAAAIEEEVLTGRMPPWQADARFDRYANTRRMSSGEIDVLVGWIGGGAPQGPRRNLAAPPEFTAGAWELGEPDLVLVPAESFVLESGQQTARREATFEVEIEEDTWVTGFEFRPEHAGTVYRMAAWIVDPAETEPESMEVEIQVPYDPFRDEDEPEPTRLYELAQGTRFLGQWLRGDAPVLLPEGMGKRLRRGSRVRVETLYERREMDGSSTPVEDRSSLGLFLAQAPDEVDLILLSARARQSESAAAATGRKERRKKRRRGSAGAGAARDVSLEFDEDVRLVGLSPHLGPGLEQVEIRLSYPDGRDDVLVFIGDYDPRWPASYLLDEPMQVPEGSRLSMQGRFRGEEAPAGAFELIADFAVNDHLVLPEIVEPPTAPQSRGGMLAIGGGEGGDLASAGAPVSTDPRAAAHMDHSPLRGGQFFMAANTYHHLEGALPAEGKFQLYVYDDFKKPVDPRNFDGRVVFETWDAEEEKWLETDYPLEHQEAGAEYMEVQIPSEMPAEFYASVWLAGKQTRFDFYFTDVTKELSAVELARYAAQGPHSHEREPVAVPETATEVAAEIQKRTDLLRDLIAEEAWLALHIPAFDARDLAEALLDKLGDLSARDRGRVRQAVSRTMQSAAELDRAGDLADPGRARRAYDRYNEAVRTLLETFE